MLEAVRKVAPNGRAVRNGIHEGIWVVSLAAGNATDDFLVTHVTQVTRCQTPGPGVVRHVLTEQHDATMLKIH